MNKNIRNNVSLLIAGFLVLLVPFIFLSSLAEKLVTRTRETRLVLLQEQLIQQALSIRSDLLPQHYFRKVALQVRQEIFGDLPERITTMRPDYNFGNDLFDSSLKERFIKSFAQKGIDIFAFVNTSPAFENYYYYFHKRLKDWCEEPEKLAQAFTRHLIIQTVEVLFPQTFDTPWKPQGQPPDNLQKILGLGGNDDFVNPVFHRYLSRYSPMRLHFDRVATSFTDYFGNQAMYFYSYWFMSRMNIHGAYSVVALQESLNPDNIIQAAIGSVPAEVTASLIDAHKDAPGLITHEKELTFSFILPTEFWVHQQYYHRANGTKALQPGSLLIRLTAAYPSEIIVAEYLNASVNFTGKIALFLFILFALRCVITGFVFPVSIRLKLAFILSIITLVPLAGVGVLLLSAENNSTRLFEQQTHLQTSNFIESFRNKQSENELRKLSIIYQLKHFISNSSADFHELFESIHSDPPVFGLWGWIHRLAAIDQNASYYENDQRFNLITKSLLSQYMDKLGLLQLSNKDHRDLMTRANFALAVLEDYLTPEIEEALIAREMTRQREITQTSDTSKAALAFINRSSDENILLYTRLLNTNSSVRYLSEMGYLPHEYFESENDYCDVEIRARSRKSGDYEQGAWPQSQPISSEFMEIFDTAFVHRAPGHIFQRNQNGFKTRLWSFITGNEIVFAAIGKAKSDNILRLAISALAPVLFIYAFIVLLILTRFLSTLVIRPLEIFGEGINQINAQKYGYLINSFSNDEFNLVTSSFNEMSVALKQREMIKRYVSDKLYENIEQSKTETETLEVTVISSDIRGFTTITETYSPAEVVAMLNSYFTEMEEVIAANGGVIDKYIGDALQAVFYPGTDLPHSAVRACNAARLMRQKLSEYNLSRAESGTFEIETGIGIATGTVISGTLGSEQGRKTYTITGEITEIAAKLESSTVNCESKILVCQRTKSCASLEGMTNHISDECWELL